MSTYTVSLSSARELLKKFGHEPIQTQVLAVGALTATLPFIRFVYNDYAAYMSLGAGGLPHNVFGWLFVTICVRPFALSKRSQSMTSDYPSSGASPDVMALPRRQGKSPDLQGIVPHRQMDQNSPKQLKDQVDNYIRSTAASNSHLLEIKRSLYEKHHEALFVRQSHFEALTSNIPQTAIISRREICHLHEDGSLHLYMSPADARIAIEKGWAERHALALPKPPFSWLGRKKPWFPIASSYLLFPGPRNEKELEVLKTFLRKGIEFMVGRDIA